MFAFVETSGHLELFDSKQIRPAKDGNGFERNALNPIILTRNNSNIAPNR